MPVMLKKPLPGAGNATSSPHSKQPAQSSGKPSFIKTGAAAVAALQEEQAKADIAREQSSKPWRFRISQKDGVGKDYLITFLDGDLDSNGLIQMNVWAEHTMQVSGDWDNYVCLAPNFCPMCAADDRADLVQAFTVIDQNPYTVQSGQKKGMTIPWQRKLYVVKRMTLGQLQKIAQKHGGLRGLQLTVCRTTTKSPAAGDMFEAQQKFSDEELAEAFPKNEKGDRQDVPFVYNDVAPFYPAEKLKELGIGTKAAVGNEPKQDLDKHL
jgi:hypothetical protein